MEATSKETILFIDDTPANLEILIRLFQQEGYKVRAVPSGQMGIRSALNDPPDLILLDVNMPGMNGYEVCRELKQNDRLCSIPVIFISALAETFDKVTAFESGGLDYITKPIQIQESLARVKTHLALRRYQRLLESKNTELQYTIDLLKETQSQLIQTEKMASLGVLTAGIAHEINNPISFIHTSALGLNKNVAFFLDLQNRYETLLNACHETGLEELRSYKTGHDFDERLSELSLLTANIVEGARRVSSIIHSLRLFARVDEAGIKAIDIHENIDSTLLLLQSKIPEYIKIVREFGEIRQVPCYPARISQVFLNLISNALEAIELKEGKEAAEQIIFQTATLVRNGQPFVSVEIRDTGCGIPDSILSHIFDPFFTTKPVGKGLGLGLSITNNIIREHGGELQATNREPSGASFRIILPLNQPQHDRQP